MIEESVSRIFLYVECFKLPWLSSVSKKLLIEIYVYATHTLLACVVLTIVETVLQSSFKSVSYIMKSGAASLLWYLMSVICKHCLAEQWECLSHISWDTLLIPSKVGILVKLKNPCLYTQWRLLWQSGLKFLSQDKTYQQYQLIV